MNDSPAFTIPGDHDTIVVNGQHYDRRTTGARPTQTREDQETLSSFDQLIADHDKWVVRMGSHDEATATHAIDEVLAQLRSAEMSALEYYRDQVTTLFWALPSKVMGALRHPLFDTRGRGDYWTTIYRAGNPRNAG